MTNIFLLRISEPANDSRGDHNTRHYMQHKAMLETDCKSVEAKLSSVMARVHAKDLHNSRDHTFEIDGSLHIVGLKTHLEEANR